MTHSSTPAGLCIVRACRGHERNAYNTHEELEKKRGEITSLPRGEEERRWKTVERREVRDEWRRNGCKKRKNRCKNRTREDGWREKRGGMGILENKVRATASVHRRRPWNGELCRFVQPAASWCAPTRYFGLSFAAERPPSANIGSKQNYKLCPTPLAPRTLPTSTIRRSCCLAPCSGLRVRLATPLPPSRRDVGHWARYSTITSRKTLNSPVSFSLGVILI